MVRETFDVEWDKAALRLLAHRHGRWVGWRSLRELVPPYDFRRTA